MIGSQTVRLETPVRSSTPLQRPEWGSDVVAEILRRLDVPFVALNPGASFRGIHDSLVNYLGNERPGIILCNHEEIAVSVAHGYAKVARRAMGAFVHSNVGLLHATMAIFNAWVDRTPVLIMGATGPMDATRRRPWIDWIHTSQGQGDVVRDFTKWEHQPSSVEAIPEAMLRAWQAIHLEPRGPAYLCFDAGLQEQRLDPSWPMILPDPARYPSPGAIVADPAAVRAAADLLVGAEFPVILLGNSPASAGAWASLVALAEATGAAVLPDLKSPATFPTSHPLLQAAPGLRSGDDFDEVLRRADVVLALGRIDVEGTLRAALTPAGERASVNGAADPSVRWPRLINVSMEPMALRSWVADYQALPTADVPILASVEPALAALEEEVRRQVADDHGARGRIEQRTRELHARRQRLNEAWQAERNRRWDESPMGLTRMVGELRGVLEQKGLYADAILARAPLGWAKGIWDFEKAGSYLGNDGGGGIGSGPGMSVGAALAVQSGGSGQTVVAMLGDGDTLMAPQALWTAAHHAIPLLFVVANNQSYFNDEEHQERVALTRGRPPENRWVGQKMHEPAVDFATMARSMGVEGFGPASDGETLRDAYERAVDVVAREGRPALVDARITTR